VDLVSLVSNSDHRLDQNVLRNRLYRYEIKKNRYPKVYPHSFKEYLRNGVRCDAHIAGGQNQNLGKAINNQKKIVISPLGG
jgi:hypothetical protein